MDECARVERPSGACSGLYEILCTLEPICKRESHIDPIRRDPCIAIRVLCGGGAVLVETARERNALNQPLSSSACLSARDGCAGRIDPR